MDLTIETYIERVMAYANRTGERAAIIRAELRDHLLEKIERIRAKGLPLEDAVFQAIELSGQPQVIGYSFRRRFPLIDVRVRGTARGVIAIGPQAVGIVSLGGIAVGFVAVGVVSCGVVGLGCVSAALLFAWGAIAVAPLGLATGALAVGLVALGVLALGIIAGGWAVGGFWAGGVQSASFYDYQTIPEWLRWLGPYVPTTDQQALIFVAILVLVLPAAALGYWAIRQEQRRLERIDPALRSL